MKVEFEKQKEEAKKRVDKKLTNITLDEWLEEWFTRYKVPKIKETSITPMKTKYRANFGRLIGNMKVAEIRNMDIQDVINTMQREGKATSSMRDALGRIRECLESAKNNRIISENPCFDITVPWENVTKERRFLSHEEQNRFLQQVENNWYKEMFIFQKKKQNKIKKELGKRYRSDGEFLDLVFVTSMGSPVFRHHAEKEVKKVVKAINEQEAFDSVREQREPHYFEALYPHAIRHTFCSRCFQLNMNPKVVQKLMGHQHYSQPP